MRGRSKDLIKLSFIFLGWTALAAYQLMLFWMFLKYYFL